MGWLRWIARARARRQTTRQLQALDDHLLRDIGVERADIPRIVAMLLEGPAGRTTPERPAMPGPLARDVPARGLRPSAPAACAPVGSAFR